MEPSVIQIDASQFQQLLDTLSKLQQRLDLIYTLFYLFVVVLGVIAFSKLFLYIFKQSIFRNTY